MIKTLWRLSREAIRYRTLYTVAILSTLARTAVNLAVPTDIVAIGTIAEVGLPNTFLFRQYATDFQVVG